MADVWVLHRTPAPATDTSAASSVLVRADTISLLRANEYSVKAGQHGATTVVLADSVDGNDALPLDFHIELVAAVTRARRAARNGDEDQVVIAELSRTGGWEWNVHPLAELR
ncbi:hypothetical protein [Streptomyces sp. V4I23]|uniref:hypothetical protein n=1 Tax=Streptomyces sp. V4I23 TaxID=3042282 RepID=UPI0027D908BA|nr:hypothetical protein [Streptomyces sp. V4I23]